MDDSIIITTLVALAQETKRFKLDHDNQTSFQGVLDSLEDL